VSTMSRIPQSQRAAWQRHAVAELANILGRSAELPVISWTVCSAGCGLVGRVNAGGARADARATFESWCQAVGLNEQAEVASSGTMLLRAAANHGVVKVTITATITTDEAAEGL
jgi:hypothetical protein